MKNVAKEKAASFNPNIKIELPKIKKLKNITICPIEKEVRLLIKMANTSVPSKDPPNRITLPTPNPKVIPPSTVTINGLPVKEGIGSKKWVTNERTVIAKRLRNRNLFPR
jgi:hypothetical protein